MPYVFVALSFIFVALGGYTLAQYEPNKTDIPSASTQSSAEVLPSPDPTAEVTIEQTDDGVNVHVETKKEGSSANGSIKQEIDVNNSVSGSGTIDTNIQSHISTE